MISQNIGGGWGHCIVIRHAYRDETGKIAMVDSQYGHLHARIAKVGQVVEKGQLIGTMGGNFGMYAVHLHFEMRTSDGVDIGAGYAMQPLNRLDPLATVDSLRNAAEDDLSPSPLARRNAVWTLARIADPSARAAMVHDGPITATYSPRPMVRLTSLRAVTLVPTRSYSLVRLLRVIIVLLLRWS